MTQIIVQIKTTNGAEVPLYATQGSAAFDLVANKFLKLYSQNPAVNLSKQLEITIEESVTELSLLPNDRVLIGTGLYMSIPDEFELQIRSRSGLSLKQGLIVTNAPGTIDSDYRGEIGVIMTNTSPQAVIINLGDRIAQGAIVPVYQARFVIVDELNETNRGEGGFGSTGIK